MDNTDKIMEGLEIAYKKMIEFKKCKKNANHYHERWESSGDFPRESFYGWECVFEIMWKCSLIPQKSYFCTRNWGSG
ncbi:MAG: hypothetical protein ACJAWV_001285 [Flammeovirgaceae bacterium]|jgi:hypothetical protein